MDPVDALRAARYRFPSAALATALTRDASALGLLDDPAPQPQPTGDATATDAESQQIADADSRSPDAEAVVPDTSRARDLPAILAAIRNRAAGGGDATLGEQIRAAVFLLEQERESARATAAADPVLLARWLVRDGKRPADDLTPAARTALAAALMERSGLTLDDFAGYDAGVTYPALCDPATACVVPGVRDVTA
jgi:hypothetical protein